MADLKTILPVTLRYEGGFSNDPRDPGGATMKGVTLASYRRHHAGATVEELKNISEAELEVIYNEDYFQPIDGPRLDQGVGMVAFDYAVNSGVGRAKPALSQTENLGNVDRVKAISSKRMSFLHGLRTWRYFGKGWANRVYGVEAIALKWAAGVVAPIVLANEAKRSKKKATAHATASIGSTATAAAGGAQHTVPTTAPTIDIGQAAAQAHINYPGALTAIIVVAVVCAAVFGFLAYRHNQRAAAMLTVANGG